MKLSVQVAAFALPLALSVPAAQASSSNLFCNGVNCGKISISNISGGVKVSLTMAGGYTIQANANNGFFFNSSLGSLTLTSFMVTPNGSVGAPFRDKSSQLWAR